VVGVVIFSRGWGSTVWTEALLTYITPVVLSTEFALDGGARWWRRIGSSGGRLPGSWSALLRSLRRHRTSMPATSCGHTAKRGVGGGAVVRGAVDEH